MSQTSTRERIRRDPLIRALPLLDLRWGSVATAILLGAGALGSALALAAVSAWLIARASQMPPVMHLSVAVVAVRAFGISRGVLRYLERLASHDLALRAMAEFRTRIYLLLAAGDTAALAPLRRGDLLARVGKDVDDVGDVVVRGLIPAGVALVLGLGAVGLVGAFLPAAALVLALCLIVSSVVVPWWTTSISARVAARDSAARTAMSESVLRIADHAPELRVAGHLEAEFAQLNHTDVALTSSTDDGARHLAWAAGINSLVVGVAVVGALILGINALESGRLAAVELAVIVLTPLAAFEASGVLPAAAVQVSRSRQAAARIMALLDAAAAGGAALPSAGAVAVAVAVADTHTATDAAVATSTTSPLEAHDVTCAWPGHDAVLTGLNLSVAPGQIIALVGPSGVGKTTALATLAGLIPPAGGAVGRAVSSAVSSAVSGAGESTGTAGGTAPAHRGDVVLTTEDAHVFHTSVLENLRVARADVDSDQAADALARVGLSTWVAGLPDGLDTLLGPSGATISGGERRRLLLARAWLSPARFILLDEPAEHLDAAAADVLLTDVLTAMAAQGRGVVMATHRLSGLGLADEVVRLEAVVASHARMPARVAARGTHAYLLAHDPAYGSAVRRD